MKRASALVMLTLVAACDGDDGAETIAPKGPFGTVGPAAVTTMSAPQQDGSPGLVQAGRTTETHTVGATAYPVWNVHRVASAAPSGGLVWMDWQPSDEVLVAAGGQIDWPDNGIVPAGQPFASGDLDAPLRIDLAPPLGVAQPLDIVGTAVVGDPSAPLTTQPFQAVGSYTLAAEGETLTTSMGPVPGCRRFEANVEVLGESHAGTFWYHPDLGLVAATLDWPPPNGVHADLAGLTDLSVVSGMTVLKAMGRIDAAQRTFGLDTYDVSGDFDADNTVHAKMLLELRWVDDAKARTTEFPALFTPDFGTVLGTYPAAFVPSPVSLFHPEENGGGFNYWIAYVDQAAKNEPGTGTSYHARVTLPEFVASPMRVTGRLIYRRLP